MEVRIGLVLRVAVAIVHDRVDLLPVVLADDRRVAPAVGASFVDVVAGVEDEVELLRGDSAERREVAGLEVVAAADREAQAIDRGPAAGAVLVRPTGLTSLPAWKRYQYSRPGCSPCASTCTLCPSSGRAITVPLSAMLRNARSRAISQPTSTFAIGIPPPSSGSGARRVHSTTLVRPRIAGRHAERERVITEEWLRKERPRDGQRRDGRRSKLPRDVQQLAPRHAAQRSIVEPDAVGHESAS